MSNTEKLISYLTKEEYIQLINKYNDYNDRYTKLINKNDIYKNRCDDAFLNNHEIKMDNFISGGFIFGKRWEKLKKIDDYLFPNHLFFLKFLENKDENLNLSSYWEFNFLIKNPKKLIQFFIEYDYIEVVQSKKGALNRLNISELKQILEKLDLTKKGKKEELINTILNSNYEVTPINIYVLTKKSKELINNNNIFFINEKIGFPFFEKDIQKYNISTIEELKKLFLIYKNKYINTFSWGLLRNLYHSMYKLTKEDIYIINMIILDLSGLSNDNLEEPDFLIITNVIKKFIKNIDIDKIDFSKTIYDELPFNYLTKEQIISIFFRIKTS